MDLNAWGPESSGPSFIYLLPGLGWHGDHVLWLWTRTPVCYSLSVTGILIAWGLGPERETFPRTWDAHGLEWSSIESHEHHSDSFCWCEKWNTSPLIPRGRIRLHLEEMAGSHYRTACRMGNTPAAPTENTSCSRQTHGSVWQIPTEGSFFEALEVLIRSYGHSIGAQNVDPQRYGSICSGTDH